MTRDPSALDPRPTSYPIRIRGAQEDDLDALVEMLHELDAHVSGAPRDVLQMTQAGEQALRDRLARLIRIPDGCVVVAEVEDGPVVAMASCGVWHEGGVWLTPERLERHTAIVDDVWVDPAWRRRGLVRRMLRELAEFAGDRGAQEVLLEYSLANPEAAETWSRLGFTPTGVRAAQGIDALRRTLREPPAEDQNRGSGGTFDGP